MNNPSSIIERIKFNSNIQSNVNKQLQACFRELRPVAPPFLYGLTLRPQPNRGGGKGLAQGQQKLANKRVAERLENNDINFRNRQTNINVQVFSS